MISLSSSLASSTPATSSKVTRVFASPETSFARLLPKANSRPPPCAERMNSHINPRRMIHGDSAIRIAVKPDWGAWISKEGTLARRRLKSPSSFMGTLT